MNRICVERSVTSQRVKTCLCGLTLQGGEPLVGEVVVGLQSFDASLENLLLLLHLLDPQLQLPLLRRPPLGQLLLPALRCLKEEEEDAESEYRIMKQKERGEGEKVRREK